MTTYGLAISITNIENSPAIGTIGAFLGLVVAGVVGLWLIATLVRRIESHIMPSLPFIAVAGFIGIIVLGLLHSFHLW